MRVVVIAAVLFVGMAAFSAAQACPGGFVPCGNNLTLCCSR